MKIVIAAAMLTGACLAQPATAQQEADHRSRSEKLFGYTNDLQHRFNINLTKQNKVIVQVSSMKVLPELMNLDSIITRTLNDIVPIKDSLETTTDNKTVDFVIDTTGEKKFRVVTNGTKGNTYTLRTGEVYALKMEQDTLRIIRLESKVKRELFMPVESEVQARWSISVVMNYLADVRQYLNGTLNQAMKEISSGEFNEDWWLKKRDKRYNVNADYYPMDPGGKKPDVKGSYGTDMLTLPSIRFGIGNIGNTFGTSFSFGASLHLDKGQRMRTFTLLGEFLYVYSREPKINLKGSLQRLITLETYSKPKGSSASNSLAFRDFFSISYMTKQSGDIFNKNTFRIGLPGIQYKYLRLTPELYFNGFFKNVSPGFKLSLALE